VLVGGSSRIPLVSEVVSDEIGRPVAVDAHPKLAVAMGAAVASQAELPAAPTNAGTSGRPDTAPFVVPPPEPMRNTAELSRGSREVSRPVLIAAGAVVAALVLGGAGWFAFGRDAGPEATANPKATERQFVEIDDIRLENGRYRVDYLVTGFVPRMGDDPDLRHIHFFLDSTDPEDAGANGEPPGEWDQTDNLSSKLTTFTPANRGTADRLCAVVVTNDHEVLDPNSGNCAALPAAPVPQRPTAPRTVRPTHSATPTSTPTVTDTPTPTVTPTAPATP
jgi:hypothetical protein